MTIGDELERIRLDHHAARVRRVLAVLYGRMDEMRAEGAPPPPALCEALRGFESELASTRVRLATLGNEGRPALAGV